MPCYTPLRVYYARRPNPSAKLSIVLNVRDGYIDSPLVVPCGQCIGCRLERSRQWAIRCVHEAQLYDSNCFITLTYNDDALKHRLASGGSPSLVKSDFQKFLKRLRKKFPGCGVRYFHCGEYGDEGDRPHYHACLFNFDFTDKVLWSVRDNVRLYISPVLQSLWPFGFSTIGDVTFESAAYVARYVLKKITGEKADDHYKGRTPEYITMSRRPGIAANWVRQFADDVYPADRVVVRGDILCRPPKYYDDLYDKMCSDYLDKPEIVSILKGNRERRAKRNPDVGNGKRLLVKMKVKKAQVSQLKRGLYGS